MSVATLPAPAKAVRQTVQEVLGFRGNQVDSFFGPATHKRFQELDPSADAYGQIRALLGFTGPDTDKDGRLTAARFQQLDDFPDLALWPPAAEILTLPEVKQLKPIGEPDTRPSQAMRGPLGSQERAATFGGPFQYRRLAGGDIQILGNWEEQNIVRVPIPQLRQIPGNFSTMAVNKRIVPQLKALWAAWENAGLLSLVLTYEGAFVPRMIRGSTTSLSNHAYGSAFDINYEWNQLGAVPARVGQRGCVRQLVASAHALGWYWGGNFSRQDGMHFEVCRIL